MLIEIRTGEVLGSPVDNEYCKIFLIMFMTTSLVINHKNHHNRRMKVILYVGSCFTFEKFLFVLLSSLFKQQEILPAIIL